MICEYVCLCVIMPLLLVGCLSTANGSALVKMGNTTVMCGIKAVSIHFPQIFFSTKTSRIGRIKLLTLGVVTSSIVNSYIVRCIFCQGIHKARILLVN